MTDTLPIHAEGVVLLVEDNPIMREIMIAGLDRLGCRYAVVSNGAEAVKFVTNVDCSIVLMDRQMPVMDGDAATRAIQRLVQ